MANNTKFVIRMKDGGYYKEIDDVHNLQTCEQIQDAHHFATRWDALVVAGRSKIFAYAAIMPYEPRREDQNDHGHAL